jgi:integrase
LTPADAAEVVLPHEGLTDGKDAILHVFEGLPAHSQRCASKRTGGACDCDPPWEAWVWSTFDKKKIRKTLATKREATKWRRRTLGLAEAGQLRAPVRITLSETAYTWLEMARAGEILTRSGRHYKPATLRTIEQDFRLRLIPELGTHFMSDIERSDLQSRVSVWQSELSPAKVHACINAARVLYRDFDLITGTDNPLVTNPTDGLRLPSVPTGGRDRIATAEEARRLIAALPPAEAVLWATALYSGMRFGELRALRAENIDFAHKRIKVLAGWDAFEGEIDPKTEKGKRNTVIVGLLDTLLREHLERRPIRPRPRVRAPRRLGVQPEHRLRPRPQGTGAGPRNRGRGGRHPRARTHPADRPSRVPAHRGLAHARREHLHRQGQQVHQAQLDHGHDRPLRAPAARRRGGGGGAAR